MLNLLERRIAAVDRRLVLLPPPGAALPGHFQNVTVDRLRYQRLVRGLQRLRGTIYLNDGAVRSEQLSPGGLHRTAEDKTSWHFLLMNDDGRLDSCLWYRIHDNITSAEQLRAWTCSLTQLDDFREPLRLSMEAELRRARREFVHYAESGGWAVSEASRCTPEAVLLPLCAYALSRVFGGGLGVATATVRHSSASILQRFGFRRMQIGGIEVQPYFDPHYNCEMELLQFDTRRPSAKYLAAIESLQRRFAQVTVIAGARPAAVAPFPFVDQPVEIGRTLTPLVGHA